jgi:endonuclease YncB( thermonuclease family)
MQGGMRRPGLNPLLVVAPLAAFTAVFLWDGGPPAASLPLTVTEPEGAVFGPCAGSMRITCVIDGDTIWYRGDKIRLADINAPETSHPGCPAEAALGKRATLRLTELLNAGAFSLQPVDRERDSYGRLLRTVTRQGRSLGAELVHEGLAEPWRGHRRDWC